MKYLKNFKAKTSKPLKPCDFVLVWHYIFFAKLSGLFVAIKKGVKTPLNII